MIVTAASGISVRVSKAASGELPMEMEELDFGKLLRQTLADMEEQIEHSSVVFRTEIPDAAAPSCAGSSSVRPLPLPCRGGCPPAGP